jgi:hypothetical protein
MDTPACESLKRINVDTVKDAFERAGITPMTSLMDHCVMGVVCPYRPSSQTHMEHFIENGFDELYIYGIMDGWDFGDLNYSSCGIICNRDDIKYKLGRADGVAARNIMNPE